MPYVHDHIMIFFMSPVHFSIKVISNCLCCLKVVETSVDHVCVVPDINKIGFCLPENSAVEVTRLCNQISSPSWDGSQTGGTVQAVVVLIVGITRKSETRMQF